MKFYLALQAWDRRVIILLTISSDGLATQRPRHAARQFSVNPCATWIYKGLHVLCGSFWLSFALNQLIKLGRGQKLGEQGYWKKARSQRDSKPRINK